MRRLGAFAVVSFVGEGVGCVEHGDVEFGGERACVCGTLVVLEEFVVGKQAQKLSWEGVGKIEQKWQCQW